MIKKHIGTISDILLIILAIIGMLFYTGNLTPKHIPNNSQLLGLIVILLVMNVSTYMKLIEIKKNEDPKKELED